MQTITTDPKICNGKPVIAGTRIPVTIILDQLASGSSIEDIQNKYPELTREQVAAALRYCHTLIEHSDLQVLIA